MVEKPYPEYDVMAGKDHWDDHTRSIVEGRLAPPRPLTFFTEQEAKTLTRLLSHLLAEDRQDLINFVVAQIDEKLTDNQGEGYHKEGLPTPREMYRQGLAALETSFGEALNDQNESTRHDTIARFTKEGFPGGTPPWGKDFFHRLMRDALSYYYSHPTLWSEIGFGGPAYPRGYVRIEHGLHDPWEAVKPHG